MEEVLVVEGLGVGDLVGVPRDGVGHTGGQVVGPRAGAGGDQPQAVHVQLGARRATGETDDECRPAAVQVEVAHGVPQRAVSPQAAEDLLELGQRCERHGFVDRSAQGTADESRDGGGDSGDGPVSAGGLRQIDTGGAQ
ncbi:hypothetical protein PQR15_37315 [Streptomyces lydicus]|nr:hypothetical protein [Streptomyces lydicus]